MNKKLRILFMGSPDFAAESLKQLCEDGFNVVGVITTPDRKKGRGQKVSESAVKKMALKFGLPIFQPTNLKNESFLSEMRDLRIDLGVVVAFRMLPEMLWNMPKLGTINLHASLLPDYRGAAPINWAIINGEKKTGLTTFFLKHEIDTGDILLQKEVDIVPSMNAGDLHDVLMTRGALLLSESVNQIERGSAVTKQQDSVSNGQVLHVAPKIYKNDCKVNWNDLASEVHNFIRGMSPYPGAWSIMITETGRELTFKIFRSSVTDQPSNNQTGQILSSGKDFMIGCSDFYIQIHEIQLEGKKRMKTEEFLKGFAIEDKIIKT